MRIVVVGVGVVQRLRTNNEPIVVVDGLDRFLEMLGEREDRRRWRRENGRASVPRNVFECCAFDFFGPSTDYKANTPKTYSEKKRTRTARAAHKLANRLRRTKTISL